MARIFTGDFATGDFSQWGQVNNKDAHGTRGAGNGDNFYVGYPDYPAQIISPDKDCGYVCRFEVRTGDVPAFGGGERSEVDTGPQIAAEGDTIWVAWSIMFDPTFPTNHQTLGWGVVGQFHDYPDGLSSPVISWGWGPLTNGDTSSGYWWLTQTPQATPGDYSLGNIALLKLPLNVGVWQDIMMQIRFKSDATGTVKCWLNGAPQTFLTGGTTFTGQTMITTVPGIHYQLGYYRQAGIAPTGIVSYTGLRIADSQASL